MPTKFFEKITEHIWEIECHHGKELFRLLAFLDGDTVVIAVHGFAKQSMDPKKQDLATAQERRRDHFQRKSITQ